jgi:hypothetical protein
MRWSDLCFVILMKCYFEYIQIAYKIKWHKYKAINQEEHLEIFFCRWHSWVSFVTVSVYYKTDFVLKGKLTNMWKWYKVICYTMNSFFTCVNYPTPIYEAHSLMHECQRQKKISKCSSWLIAISCHCHLISVFIILVTTIT